MRVLHVYKSYYPDTVGGIEQVIAQLGTGLRGFGVESRVYTLSPNPEPRVLARPEGEVHRSMMTAEIASATLSIEALSEFRRQLAWADIVHYQFPWPFADVLHLLSARRKPSVVSYQSDIVRQKLLLKAYAPLMKRFLNSVSAVVATSPEYARSSEVLRSLHSRVEVIPNGVDETTYPQPEEHSLAQWKERVGDDFFLFVGVLRYYKGLHTLVEAARRLDGRVVIAGAGPEHKALQDLAQRHGLTNVHFVGRVSDQDKVALLALCRAFVFPSHMRSEAFGMSLVEAAMRGKPMISCRIETGTSYINLDGVTGWTVAPNDADGLLRAMRKLREDSEGARTMGVAARARYEELFTAQRMAEAYHRLYRNILDAAR
jgi:glycosyltransferase involved in cell wall biosynthesis